MEVVYHAGALPEAEITASADQFAAMVGRIAELVRVAAGEIVFPAVAGRGLVGLVVRIGSGAALVVVDGDGMLAVSGSPEAIGLFARNMPCEPSLPAGYHIHFEHDGREWFVAAESVPLVMMVGSGADA